MGETNNATNNKTNSKTNTKTNKTANKTANRKIGALLLAAGASARMKQPKQLLIYEGKTLLRRAAETVAALECAAAIVVLGALSDAMRAEIADLPLEICVNENWQDGLSSSLKAGLEKLFDDAPEIDAFLVMLADQPFVETKHLQHLIDRFDESNAEIVAARYREVNGVPAVFSKNLAGDFAEITGDKGAKTIIEKYRESLQTIDLPEAASDIDTPEDFLKMKASGER